MPEVGARIQGGTGARRGSPDRFHIEEEPPLLTLQLDVSGADAEVIADACGALGKDGRELLRRQQ